MSDRGAYMKEYMRKRRAKNSMKKAREKAQARGFASWYTRPSTAPKPDPTRRLSASGIPAYTDKKGISLCHVGSYSE